MVDSNDDKLNSPAPRIGDITLYTTTTGDVRVEVMFQEETLWLTQKQIAELFDVDVRTVSEHIQSIFSSGELQEDSVIRKIRNTASDGKSYLTNFYLLQFNEYEILHDAGRISHEVAKRLTEEEYERFRVEQDRIFESDFERETKRLKRGKSS